MQTIVFFKPEPALVAAIRAAIERRKTAELMRAVKAARQVASTT